MTRPDLLAHALRSGVAATLLVGAVACGGSNKAKAAAPTSGNAVMVKDFKFLPPNLVTKVGTKVTWTFADAQEHNDRFDDASIPLIGGTEGMKNGQSAGYTFTKAGTFAYKCGIHNYMTGVVTVEA